jgi:chorismate synthase
LADTEQPCRTNKSSSTRIDCLFLLLMSGNTFGTIFKLTSFGESHGPAIGGVIDGCPAGLKLDLDAIQKELNRRKPGQSSITTQRIETDQVQFLSGIFENVTTGAPIGFTIKNDDQRSVDYKHLQQAYRPSHADFTYEKKYGLRDYRGGGRSSARETAIRVVGGAIAKQLLTTQSISIHAFVKQVGKVKLEKNFDQVDLTKTDTNELRCPDEQIAQAMKKHLAEVQQKGDSVGGIIQCVILNSPIGLGEPVYNKLNAALGHAMLGINAVKGFELGSGFDSVSFTGSELNDQFQKDAGTGNIITITNNSGGIQGGISNGMPIYFNLAFKPVATIMMDQETVNSEGDKQKLEGKGRHDPCVVPRAVPIVESMAALVMADFLLLARCSRL